MTAAVSGSGNAAFRVVRLLLIAQLALAAVGVGTWRYTRAAAPGPPAGPRPEPGRSVQRPATLESAYSVALTRAEEWSARARLFAVSEQVDWPQDVQNGPTGDVPGGGWLFYVFAAPWQRAGRPDGAATLSLVIERNSAEIYQEQTLSWDTEPPPLTAGFKVDPIDSATAALAAEVAGGSAYRRACPALRHVSRVVLGTTRQGDAEWTVTYQDIRHGGQNALTVRIDPKTGAIGQVEDRSTPCDAPAPQ